MRQAVAVALTALALSGCAVQRAQVAQEARSQMIGLKKEQVLACMGPPAQKSVEGSTEVWSYSSGDGTTISSASVSGNTWGPGRFGPGWNASGVGVTRQRFCTIHVVMARGEVSAVNYTGPTGGLLTAGEQCAFAIQNCVQTQ